jgi:hypothetical protein
MQHGYTSLTYGTEVSIDGAKSFYIPYVRIKCHKWLLLRSTGQKRISAYI